MRDATLKDYRWLYANGYMTDGMKCARAIMLDIVERCPGTFLDYGCGRGQLVAWINQKTRGFSFGYDPASNIAATREPLSPTTRVDWVISCDVLEHIERDDVSAALQWMRDHANKGLLLTIANMSDVHEVNGDPVELHLIREPAEWWVDRIRQHWPACRVEHRRICKDRFVLIVEFA